VKKRKKRVQQGEPQNVTYAVTHIRLDVANSAKLATLDQLVKEFLALTQQYVILFCTDELPDSFRAPCFPTLLSERWHRVAMQQAAGIAKSWRTNRANASQDYLDALANYHKQQAGGTLEDGAKEPSWREWDVPTLRQPCIQANCNVVSLESARDSTFDCWLKISTLDKGKPLLLPILFSNYHKELLVDRETGQRRKINSSVVLNKRNGVWWLSLSYDQEVAAQTKPDAHVIGIDVGIVNFITTSDGKQYGSFNGKLRERAARDREKRRRKSKLRKCLEKNGVPKDKLPSTTSATGQRLTRHVKQSINRATNLCFIDPDHEGCQYAYEQLSVASMRFKARAMNASLHASNLGHIPRQIEWNATKRGIAATRVKSAYSSQECHLCHYVDRKNRPNQGTFHCQVCHHTVHADLNAAQNLATRFDDGELRSCQKRQEVKALLLKRHEQWKQNFSLVVVQAPAQLGLWNHLTDDPDALQRA